MYRVVLTVLFAAALAAATGSASQGRVSAGLTQQELASKAALCDRLDAELGPKHVPFEAWFGC